MTEWGTRAGKWPVRTKSPRCGHEWVSPPPPAASVDNQNDESHPAHKCNNRLRHLSRCVCACHATINRR